MTGQQTAKQVGANIAAARKAPGMQQIALAQKLGIGSSSLCNWESGDRMAPTERLIQIAEALDVPVATFFQGIGRMPNAYQVGFGDGWRQCAARAARATEHVRVTVGDEQSEAVSAP